jgi:hypothetical protein
MQRTYLDAKVKNVGRIALALALVLTLTLTLTLATQVKTAYADTVTYYAKLTIKNTHKYSSFKKDLTQTWKNFDATKYKKLLKTVNKANADDVYTGQALDWSATFGTIKLKTTTKITVGKLTTKQPSYKVSSLGFSADSLDSAKSTYAKIVASIKKKPSGVPNWYSYFSEKNTPNLTITIGDQNFAIFKVADIHLDQIGKLKTTKTTISGKYNISAYISYKENVTNAQVAEFLTAVSNISSKETISYSFKTPKIKASAKEFGGGFHEKPDYGTSGPTSNSYTGYAKFANKSFTVVETVTPKSK